MLIFKDYDMKICAWRNDLDLCNAADKPPLNKGFYQYFTLNSDSKGSFFQGRMLFQVGCACF